MFTMLRKPSNMQMYCTDDLHPDDPFDALSLTDGNGRAPVQPGYQQDDAKLVMSPMQVMENMPICFSRLDRDRGDCEHANCCFKHECPCCGDNHPAKQCQKWDASKAKRAAEQAKKPRN